MFNKKLALILSFSCYVCSQLTQAGTEGDNVLRHPFYIGALGGYGSTTWEGLVPTVINQNFALSVSTPVAVQEGGSVWGFMTGYEFTPFFALEASYTNYQTAQVFFDSLSIFSIMNNDRTELYSDTETLSLMAKVMLVIPDTKLRFFSSLGVADVHRNDMLTDQWHVGPTFGGGLNYHFNEHFMGELGGNYTAGWGESQLNPSLSYIPFLYSFTLRLAYFF